MKSDKTLFAPDDDKNFIVFVTEHLKKGAASRRGIRDVDYIRLARESWKSCTPDKVYEMKLLVDPLVQPELAAEAPEILKHSHRPFCTLIARIGPDGELIDAPAGYVRTPKEGEYLAHIAIGSPSGGVVPDPAEPAEYLIAFFDVLGFEALLNRIGLDALIRRYETLLSVALAPNSESRPWSLSQTFVKGTLSPALMWLPIQTAYFSDSLLMWVPYHPGHVAEFLNRCSAVFCAALAQSLPVRGAISAGRAVLDKTKGVYLGQPLVEAVRLESKSNWIGVCLATSWKSKDLHIPVPPDTVFIYNAPLKDGGVALSSGLVLDWPRVWRESRQDSALPYITELRLPDLSEELKSRYDAASTFWLHSEQNQNWCVPPGCTRITARGPKRIIK